MPECGTPLGRWWGDAKHAWPDQIDAKPRAGGLPQVSFGGFQTKEVSALDKGTFDPAPHIAQELSLPESSVRSAVGLLQEGNSVPFLARYRKEATGGLDEVQLRDIEERRAYLLELSDRRDAILVCGCMLKGRGGLQRLRRAIVPGDQV